MPQLKIGETVIQGNQLVATVLAPLLIGTIAIVLAKTRIGSIVRGVGQNRELALPGRL